MSVSAVNRDAGSCQVTTTGTTTHSLTRCVTAGPAADRSSPRHRVRQYKSQTTGQR